MRPRNISLAVAVLLGVSALAVSAQQPNPRQWGTVRGRVVWAEKAIPANRPVAGVPRNLGILQDKIVVHPQNRGVRWVLVWLADPKDARNAKFSPPIHPSFTNPPPAAAVAMGGRGFEPRVTGLWAKTDMTIKNPRRRRKRSSSRRSAPDRTPAC